MKHIMSRVCAWILIALPVALLLQSCKSDDEDFLKDFPSECTVKCGESRPLIDVAEDALVIPAAIAGLKWASDDDDVAIVEKGAILGVGAGETEVRIYDASGAKVLATVRVKVLPTASVTLKAGETVELKEIFSEEMLDGYTRCSSSDKTVATTKAGDWNQAATTLVAGEYPGTAYISIATTYGTRPALSLEVNVVKATEATYFPLPYLEYGSTPEEVKDHMGGYTLDFEGKENYSNILRYKPFGSAISVTYYFSERYMGMNQPKRLELASVTVETGKESAEMLPYLLSNYKCNLTYPWRGSCYFLISEVEHWRITPVFSNDWSSLEFNYSPYY